jgi:hypothetical protein
MKRLLATAVIAAGLCACGGGGGGGTTPAQPPTPASISGDMLAVAPSRGWNYQATYQGTSLTVSIYSDPTPLSDGSTALIVTGTIGLVPTVLTSASAATSGLVAVLTVSKASGGYNAVGEASVGSTSPIPGTPLLVASTLTQGTTTTPSPGVTETVTSVGAVPNANVCPTPGQGATVTYTYSGATYTISYVPGCGITQIVASTGATFNLVSVGTYSSVGQLSIARRVGSATLVDTARSLLGLERNSFPTAALLSGFLRRP